MNIENMIHVPTVEPEKNDYRGDDGLLHCGVCGEPKEAFFEAGFLLGGKDRHPADCRCQRERKEREEKAQRERQHRDNVMQYKAACFKFPEMQRWTFDRAIQTGQYHKCMEYVQRWPDMYRENKGLLLWGAVGTGKSYLAACIANALLEQEVRVYMTNLADVINYGFDGRNEYIDKLCRAPLLILDDLGMERNTAFGVETVFQVIDGRCIRQKPLIVTTNLTLEEMDNPGCDDRYRIYNRVRSVTVPVCFAGENLRDRQRKENMDYMRGILGGAERGRADG